MAQLSTGRQLVVAAATFLGALFASGNGLVLTVYQEAGQLCEEIEDPNIHFRCLQRVATQNWFQLRPELWTFTAICAVVFVVSLTFLVKTRQRPPRLTA